MKNLKLLISNKGYIDPSVMTYTIQAIAGVVIAVGAVIGIRIRKAKKKLAEKLNIDENKNKEVEGDDIVVNLDEEKTEN
ncbi:MAG: hypothetical protein K2J77_05445 [Oscillospiraceae bacterium]|nr:hypothetical protein [Oscillospiraceae bacterium]